MKKIIISISTIIYFLLFLNYYEVNNVDNIHYTNPNNYLKIEKINLYQNIYSYNDSSVDENIIYLKESDFNKDFYILAAHSGNSKIAYFKNIYKLNKKDNVKLFINGKDLDFIVEKVYYVKKTGNIILPVDSKNILYLTTCDKFNNKQQLIIKCVKKV